MKPKEVADHPAKVHTKKSKGKKIKQEERMRLLALGLVPIKVWGSFPP